MTRLIACFSVSFSLWLATAGTAVAQTMVEYGLGASRAATTTAPASGIGKSLSGLAGSLDKATKAAGAQNSETKPAATATATKAAAAAREPLTTPTTSVDNVPVPPPSWEDPSGIDSGLAYDELIRRFGPSSMAITDGAEKMLTYRGKEGIFQVRVQDGAVKSIEKPKPQV
jgi:hypothetical protein